MALFMSQLPGKKSLGSASWKLQAQISLVMWLGLREERQLILSCLPPGYKKLKKSDSSASLSNDVTRSLSYLS